MNLTLSPIAPPEINLVVNQVEKKVSLSEAEIQAFKTLLAGSLVATGEAKKEHEYVILTAGTVPGPCADQTQPAKIAVKCIPEEETAATAGESAIVATAISTAYAANAMGIGGTILHQGTGIYLYAKAINTLGVLGSIQPIQYAAARLANQTAFNMVNKAVIGTVTGGTLATVGFAVLTAMTVAEVGELGYNTLVAKKEEEKISINLFSLGKRAFNMFSGNLSAKASKKAAAAA